MESLHYYMASRFFIVYIFTIILTFTVCSPSDTMASNNNLYTDVTMESLVAEIQNVKANLTALQTQESLQNLSLDERRRERPHYHHPPSKPHNTKIQYFANVPGENFLAWRSQF